MEKGPLAPWLFRVSIGDEKLSSYVGTTCINHDIRIPIKHYRIQNESKAVFFSCSDTQPTAMLDSIRSLGGVKGFNITLQAKK